jgi:polyisoprenyl-phosphate glycosyltransferase
MSTPTYSIVIPVHNEEDTLPELHSRLGAVLDRLDGTAEVILVDDGSQDASFVVMRELHRRDPRVKLVRLSRNFGHQVAITSGMDLAAGDAVVVIDADLQDPPEVILEMAEQWRKGYEIVYGVRSDRSADSVFKRTTAHLFYRGLRRLTDVDIPLDAGDFRLVDRRAVDAFKGMREGSRFVRGMFSWMGFNAIGVTYRRDKRYAGATKYSFRKMFRLAVDGVVGFSRVPLRFALNVGFVMAAFAMVGGAAALAVKFAGIYSTPGWSSLTMIICFFAGLQLAVLGVMGEYIGRTYEEAVGRPLYIVSELHGLPVPFESPARAVIAGPRNLASLIGDVNEPVVTVRVPDPA